jgi:hypothetical protein
VLLLGREKKRQHSLLLSLSNSEYSGKISSKVSAQQKARIKGVRLTEGVVE